MNRKGSMLILASTMLALGYGLGSATAAQAEVYKTVDENGNVIFTDQPPTPDSEPIKMRELSVVPARPVEQKPVRAKVSDGNADGQIEDLATLRRGYRDFRITQPMPEQSFTGTANTATLAWDTKFELQKGMQVLFSINGQSMEPTTAQIVTTDPLDRGEHTVSAQLVDARGRTVATAAPVTFFVRQWSRNFGQRAGGG